MMNRAGEGNYVCGGNMSIVFAKTLDSGKLNAIIRTISSVSQPGISLERSNGKRNSYSKYIWRPTLAVRPAGARIAEPQSRQKRPASIGPEASKMNPTIDNGGNFADTENFAARPRTLGESIDGWSRKHWNFSGRASRSEFWWTCAFIGLLQTAFTLTVPGLFHSPNAMWIARIVINVWFLIPVLAVLTRRLHDIGRSGWWLWAILLPWLTDVFALDEWRLFADYMADANLPGLIWLLHSAISVGLLVWWGCKPGQSDKNRFNEAT